MIIAATGHRPDKLGGYSRATLVRCKQTALEHFQLMPVEPSRVISGMALGWDMGVAFAALALRIPFTAAVPFDGQESRWPEEWQAVYRDLLDSADHVVVVSPGGYSGAKMHRRNVWMVNQCDHVLALWNGSEGGTFDAINYANQIGKPLTNLWTEFANTRPAPRVWNKWREYPKTAVSVMRGTPWGNSFKIGALWNGRPMTRDDVCTRFECETLPTLDVSELRGRDLLCCCKPHRCHADSILRKANA